MDLQINEKFEKLIPKLPMEQYTVLLDDINEHGIRDPFLVWNNVIIDGHNRYRIAQELGITDVPTKDITFADDDEAAVYIVKNQSMRRNLNMAQRLRFAFMLEPQLKKLAKEKQAGAKGAKVDVLADIGKIAGVGKDTVSKYRFVYDKADAKQLDALESGELKITQLWKLLQPKKETEPVKLPKPPTDLVGILLQKLDKNEKVEKATITALKDEKGKWDVHWRIQEKREKKERIVSNIGRWKKLLKLLTLSKVEGVYIDANKESLTCSILADDDLLGGRIIYPNEFKIKEDQFGVGIKDLKTLTANLKSIELGIIEEKKSHNILSRFLILKDKTNESQIGTMRVHKYTQPPSTIGSPHVVIELTDSEIESMKKYKSEYDSTKRFMAFVKDSEKYKIKLDVGIETSATDFWRGEEYSMIHKFEMNLETVNEYEELESAIVIPSSRFIQLITKGIKKVNIYGYQIVECSSETDDIKSQYFIKGKDFKSLM